MQPTIQRDNMSKQEKKFSKKKRKGIVKTLAAQRLYSTIVTILDKPFAFLFIHWKKELQNAKAPILNGFLVEFFHISQIHHKSR